MGSSPSTIDYLYISCKELDLCNLLLPSESLFLKCFWAIDYLGNFFAFDGVFGAPKSYELICLLLKFKDFPE